MTIVERSKILGNMHPAFTPTWLASDFRSTLTTTRQLKSSWTLAETIRTLLHA